MHKFNKNWLTGSFKLSESQEALIRQKVALLPQQERLAIYFHFWEQHSHMRIAANLRIAISEVSPLIQKAMIRLRADLEEIADSYFGPYSPKEMDQAS